jgi:hypothetical protein
VDAARNVQEVFEPVTSPEAPGRPAGPGMSLLLPAAGLVYLGLGLVLGGAWLIGEARSSLFPTGWILPAVLVVTGTLMVLRRRFDLVGVLWAALAIAVFQLNLAIYLDGVALGLDDPSAFDASVLVAILGLVPLVLRRGFCR